MSDAIHAGSAPTAVGSYPHARRVGHTLYLSGIGPRDHTSEVVRELVSFEIPGIAEEIRRQGSGHTRLALLSREVAGAVLRPDAPPALVLAVPGSRGGIRDAIGVVGDLIDEIIDQLDGAGHR